MPDPYEVDDDGNPVAEAEAAADPAEGDLLRRQIEATLRFVALSTIVGVVVIGVLAAILADERGVLILVGCVYLITSVVAYLVLRRNLMGRLKRYEASSSAGE